VLIGNGTSGINSVAPSTSGNVLTSDGTSWTSATNFGAAKAWVQWVGASGSINGSLNVSSVTRNSTGNYTVNFTTVMPNANYSFVTGNSPSASGQDGTVLLSNPSSVPTASAINLLNGKPGSINGGFTSNLVDCPYNCVTIFSS